MKSIDKKISVFLMLIFIVTMISACNTSKYSETDTVIISADSLKSYIGKDNVVIIDMQSKNDFAANHVTGAVNIIKNDIVIFEPVDNMLAPANIINEVMSKNGINNNSTVIVYDSDKMSASRMLWTLFMYGHENVKVVNGGISAIKNAGIKLTTDITLPIRANFTAEMKDDWLATYHDVNSQVNYPIKNVLLLDVRTDEEYKQTGKIPSSIMMDFNLNFYSDGTFKDTQTTKINYLEAKILPENEIIIYCQTSMRAASVFVRLYDAGYRNIKIYDGAYMEWLSDPKNPVDKPTGSDTIVPDKKDAS